MQETLKQALKGQSGQIRSARVVVDSSTIGHTSLLVLNFFYLDLLKRAQISKALNAHIINGLGGQQVCKRWSPELIPWNRFLGLLKRIQIRALVLFKDWLCAPPKL